MSKVKYTHSYCWTLVASCNHWFCCHIHVLPHIPLGRGNTNLLVKHDIPCLTDTNLFSASISLGWLCVWGSPAFYLCSSIFVDLVLATAWLYVMMLSCLSVALSLCWSVCLFFFPNAAWHSATGGFSYRLQYTCFNVRSWLSEHCVVYQVHIFSWTVRWRYDINT